MLFLELYNSENIPPHLLLLYFFLSRNACIKIRNYETPTIESQSSSSARLERRGKCAYSFLRILTFLRLRFFKVKSSSAIWPHPWLSIFFRLINKDYYFADFSFLNCGFFDLLKFHFLGATPVLQQKPTILATSILQPGFTRDLNFSFFCSEVSFINFWCHNLVLVFSLTILSFLVCNF